MSMSTDITACDDEGEVRLVGGQNKYEGRVEVCNNEEWKTVCDRGWREEEAEVVCRQLGYSEHTNCLFTLNNPNTFTHIAKLAVAIPVRRGCAGQGSGGIFTGSVWRCDGSESKLLDCNRNNSTLCDHNRDAGVYCSGELKLLHTM